MSQLRSVLALALCFGSAASGCGGDDDSDGASPSGGSSAGSGAGSGSAADSGAGAGSGAGVDLDVDEDAVASELSADEVQDVCAALDDAAGLLGNVERACQVEAWLATFEQAECESIVEQCNDNGATMLELERPSACAEQGEELPDCDVTVGEMIACAEQYGTFWASRTCDMEALFDEGPTCDEDLAMRCPSLYAESDDGGSSGGSGSEGSCGGLAPSCVLQSSSVLCMGVDGCLWLSSSETCSGVAQACSSYSSEAGCIGQDGCSWTP
jgi:hypothetical protein